MSGLVDTSVIVRYLTGDPPDLADRIGRPRATRAVANALGQNRIALAIPCHRVVPAQTGKGSGGYRWGADRKAALLAAEHLG